MGSPWGPQRGGEEVRQVSGKEGMKKGEERHGEKKKWRE